MSINWRFIPTGLIEVFQYSYRTAFVDCCMIELERNDIAGKELESYLAKKANAWLDNHTVYDIYQTQHDSHLYVQCTDSKIRIGASIVRGRW